MAGQHLYNPFPAPFAVVGPNGSAKLTLGPGLTKDVWDSIFGAGTADAIRDRTSQTLAGQAGWTRQGWFRKCADVRAKSVATLPWAIYPEGADNDTDPIWKNDDASVPDALAVLSNLELAFYLAEASLALCGAAYFGRRMVEPGSRIAGSSLGRFAGLMYWNPKSVVPRFDQQGISHFERHLAGGIVKVLPEAVVYAWQPDPFVELGPGSSDGDAAGTGAAALDSLSRLLARSMNSGLVKMTVLSLDEQAETTEEQRSTLRSLWARILRRGTDIDGGPPIIQGGKVSPVTIGDGLKDIQSKDISQEQREHVATSFGIPWSIMQSSAANFATAQVEERGFYLRTVIPQANIIEQALNERLFREYGLTLRFEPERHEVMQAWELEKAEKVSGLTGGKPILTRNEARQLLGYEEIPEWNEPDLTEAPRPRIEVATRSLDRASKPLLIGTSGTDTNGWPGAAVRIGASVEPATWRDERDERIRTDYPDLRNTFGKDQALEELAERESLSVRQVRRILYEGTRT